MWVKIAIPFIGAFIGWITNWIAIKLLFHPKKKILGYQGLLWKYKDKLIEDTATYVDKELIDIEILRTHIDKEMIEKSIGKTIQGLPWWKRFLVRKGTDWFIEDVVDKEGYLKKEILKAIPKDTIKNVVQEKLHSLPMEDMEKIILEATGKHLRFIVWTGAVLGFIIGWLQVIITTIF